jgi:hypothetical protein
MKRLAKTGGHRMLFMVIERFKDAKQYTAKYTKKAEYCQKD